MGKRHLGTGVHIEYDGFGMTLTTEDGENVTNTIYLNLNVLDAMTQYNRDVASEIRVTNAKNNELREKKWPAK